jgi:hypothetical protein
LQNTRTSCQNAARACSISASLGPQAHPLSSGADPARGAVVHAARLGSARGRCLQANSHLNRKLLVRVAASGFIVTDRSKVRTEAACMPLCCRSNSTDRMWSYGMSSGLKVYRNARCSGYSTPACSLHLSHSPVSVLQALWCIPRVHVCMCAQSTLQAGTQLQDVGSAAGSAFASTGRGARQNWRS